MKTTAISNVFVAVVIASLTLDSTPVAGQSLPRPHATVERLNNAFIRGNPTDPIARKSKVGSLLQALQNYCLAVQNSVEPLSQEERRLFDEQLRKDFVASTRTKLSARNAVSSFGSNCAYSARMALNARSDSTRCGELIDLARTFQNASSPGGELWTQTSRLGLPEAMGVNPIFYHQITSNVLFTTKIVCESLSAQDGN